MILLETVLGTVFLLRVPGSWAPTPAAMEGLASELVPYSGMHYEWNDIASSVGWKLETRLDLLDCDLVAPLTPDWPVRATALAQCAASQAATSASALAEQADSMTNSLNIELEAKLRTFTEGLDPNIISLAERWGGLSIGKHNFFAGVRGTRRLYRIQAARVSPVLASALCGEGRKPEQFEENLTRVIDLGRPLIEGLAEVCGVLPVAARHALRMPAELLAGGRLSLFTRALGQLSPELYPRMLADWKIMERLLRSVLPTLTGRPSGASVNLSLLPTLARKGWANAGAHLAKLGVDTPQQVRDLIAMMHRAVAWDLMRSEGWGETEANTAAILAVDECVSAVGVIRLAEVARAWPELLRKAQAALANDHALLRGMRWIGVLDSSVHFGGLVIEQLLTAEACTEVGAALNNCIASYAASCASERGAHLFAIRDPVTGSWRGALHLTFSTDRHGRHRGNVRELLGPSNRPIGAAGKQAAEAFCAWLSSEEGQHRISEMIRKRLHSRGVTNDEVKLRVELEPVVIALRGTSLMTIRFEAGRSRSGQSRKHTFRPVPQFSANGSC